MEIEASMEAALRAVVMGEGVDLRVSSMLNSALDDVTDFVNAQTGSKFPTLHGLTEQLGPGVRNRMSLDVVYPTLAFNSNEQVVLDYGPESDSHHNGEVLFNMSEPIIDQLLYLKHFWTPENGPFFEQWAMKHGFGASKDVSRWFDQKLPVIDMSNPIQGAMETLRFAGL